MTVSGHDAVEVIAAKRDGHALTGAQIDWVVDGFTSGQVADVQMASLAMAIVAAHRLDGRERILGWGGRRGGL